MRQEQSIQRDGKPDPGTVSIWSRTCEIPPREPLPGALRTEVAVIGAGMAGVLIAAALQRAGRKVVVLEAGRIGSGQTRNTTAKVTSQHGLAYKKLIGAVGQERAREYADANQTALRAYRELIEKNNIQCDFQDRPSFVYGKDVAQLQTEAEAAAGLGLPASFVSEVPLPFSPLGAVRFDGQAQFHPLKFLRAMSEGLTIYEHTPVLNVEGGTLETDRGRVEAEQVVFATHFPFVNFPGMYFARMHQERSYVLALEDAGALDGMFLGSGAEVFSFRDYGGLLLLGGAGHRTGEGSQGGHYEALRQKARQWFPGSREVARWSAQDCVTPDSVPYIGQYAPSAPDWFVATGFQKWGMTTSMVAALLLPDLMAGKKSPWPVFDPGRFDLKLLSGVAAESGQAVKGLSRELFQVPAEAAADIPPGHGGIVTLGDRKVGVYKDPAGELYPVDVRCPHLGCQLEWDPDELSWDCPCHGSRFDRFGRLISGPAQEDLRRP